MSHVMRDQTATLNFQDSTKNSLRIKDNGYINTDTKS